MKKLLFILAIVLSTPLHVFAQATGPAGTVPQNEILTLEPVITSEDFVRVDKKIIFDASDTVKPVDEEANYTWNFGDNTGQSGVEVVHQYGRTGTYTVSLTVQYKDQQSIVEKSIFVYDQKMVLVVEGKSMDALKQMAQDAQTNGVALKIFSPPGNAEDFASEDVIVKSLVEQTEYIRDSDALIFYTKSLRGLQSFIRFWQDLPADAKSVIQKKLFLVITEGNLDVAAHGTFQNYQIMQPSFILVSRPAAVIQLLKTNDMSSFEGMLFSKEIEYRHVDAQSARSQWFVLSRLVTFFIEKGVSADSVYLLLVIPFLALITIFYRHVIGISTFGVYTPVIIAVAFYMLGLGFGLLTFMMAVIASYFVKWLFNKVELLYLPRVALNLSFISLSFVLLMLVALLVGSPISLSLAVFPMLVMSNLSERFLAAKSEEGLRNAVIGVIETLVVVVSCYFLMKWASFNNIVISLPEIVVFPLVGIIILGKFSGLRLSEYFRFRSLFSDHAEE